MLRIAVFLSALAIALPAIAGERPSAGDLVNRLRPTSITRGFVPKGVTIEGGGKPEAPPSVNLEVNFEFNSAVLTTDAALTLDQLGRALGDAALVAFRFRVAGHTDGVGGDDVNQALSESRAAAVKEYLVRHHGIVADRLDAAGYGKSQLLDPAHPEAAINRRVQITNIGGG